MPIWIIEPRDPLIVRDGRPFGPDPGVRATSLAFPFPSTTTGAARNRFGLDDGGRFDHSRINAVKHLSVRGPLLVELDDEEHLSWFAPAPADALLVGEVGQTVVYPLRPLALSEDTATSLGAGRHPVGLAERVREKPSGNSPQFWTWAHFEQWLHTPQQHSIVPAELGIKGLLRDVRTHVSISDQGLTASEGALFQTMGLTFVGSDRQRLALAIHTDEPFPYFSGGLAPLAGERRLVTWRPSNALFPECPPAVRAAIVRNGTCRALLLTPAFFANGSQPNPLLIPRHGVTPKLIAACITRPQVVSGWDMQQHRPKPTRRLTPAGAVFFLALEGDEAARAAWVDAHWMACVGDEADGFDACREGFGLLALGSWDGQLVEMGGRNARS